MRPTVDEQLAGIDRLLKLIAADAALSEESTQLLRDATRQLGRLRGSLPARPAFLRWDNTATLAVLDAVAPLVPSELQVAIASRGEPDSDHLSIDDPELDAAALNDRLRNLLTEALHALPETVDGEDARLKIVEHLRARVDANPALNKNPVIPDDGPWPP